MRGADASTIAKAQASHKILWCKYFLQQVINSVGVATITKVVDEKYAAALKKDYVGFVGVKVFQLLKHFRT